MLLCLVVAPVFAQQSMWLETHIQTEIKMSLRLKQKNQKKPPNLVEVQENAVEAFRETLPSESGKPHNHLPYLHKDSLP